MQPRMTFKNPNADKLEDHIRASAALGLPLLQKDCHKDAPGFLVCGTAPSLVEPDNWAEVERLAGLGYIVVALKEAITLLTERGIRVHYTFAMDPDAKQVAKTPLVDGVIYCLASSCSPAMYQHVMAGGHEVKIFHSACGLKNETDLYVDLFGKGDVVVGGYTLGNRAVAGCMYMGATKVHTAGIMFGVRTSQEGCQTNEAKGYYADGVVGKPGNTGAWFEDGGKVDGTVWWTKLDLMASALDMARHIKNGLVEVIGESLARSLAMHPDEFYDSIARKESTYYFRPGRVMVSNPAALVKAMLLTMQETLPLLEPELAA